jgi:hypothetical protein
MFAVRARGSDVCKPVEMSTVSALQDLLDAGFIQVRVSVYFRNINFRHEQQAEFDERAARLVPIVSSSSGGMFVVSVLKTSMASIPVHYYCIGNSSSMRDLVVRF